MRTQIVPAQITTVEDKIAGNLSVTQMILLILPVFWAVVVFTLFLPVFNIVWYKIPLVGVVVAVSLMLALRIRGKVVFHWLLLILRYNLRPAYYVFDKNDTTSRIIDVPVFEKRQRKLFHKGTVKQEAKKPNFTFADLVQLEGLLANPKYRLSLKAAKKGGLNVAFEQK